MSRLSLSAATLLCAALLGCAATRVETTGTPLPAALCPPGGPPLSAQVYWMPQWRPDQKEPERREAAALQGLQDYFATTPCGGRADIRRLGAETAAVPTDEQLLRLAAAATPVPDRVLLVVVRELGPRLVIGIPALVEGSTEVVLEVRVLDVRSAATLANARVHWENGGTFVVKGVKTLPQDMRAALQSVLTPEAP